MKQKASPSSLFHPWFIFLIFFSLNAAATWGPGPLSLRATLCLLIAIPFGWLVLSKPLSKKSEPLWSLESLHPPSLTIVFLFLSLALGIRLYHLTEIPVWPMIDEGAASFFSSQLNRQWQWNLFFDFNHLPPVFFWLLALFFKLCPPSLFSLWLFPALISFATVGMGYLACRHYFSRSFSLLWALGWSFSFWPLYIGRFSIPPTLMPLWVGWCLLLLARFLKAEQPRRQRAWGALLGASLSLGFYLAFQWLALPLMIAAAVLFYCLSIRGGNKKLLLILSVLLPALLILTPLVLGRLSFPHEPYLQGLWAFHENFHWLPYLQTSSSYFTALFWGTNPSIEEFGYKPLGGGLLNPFLGALFFMGLLELFRKKNHPWAQWILWTLLMVFIPALLTNNLELFRLIESAPLILAGLVLGLQWLLLGLENKKRVFALAVLGLFSFGTDLYHLDRTTPHFWKNHPDLWEKNGKLMETYRAYQQLKPISEARGPGLLLTEFTVHLEKDPRNKSLVLACYPFDVSRNPRLKAEKAAWAALLVNSDQIPFIADRWKGVQPIPLGRELDYLRKDQEYFLVLLPVNPQTQPVLDRWVWANDFFERILFKSLCPSSKDFRRKLCDELSSGYSLVKDDPFLESCYWRLLGQASEKDNNSYLKVYSLKRFIQCGHPAAEDYRQLGIFSLNAADFVEAEKAFRLAQSMDPPLALPPKTWERLQAQSKLQRLQKISSPPKPLSPPESKGP